VSSLELYLIGLIVALIFFWDYVAPRLDFLLSDRHADARRLMLLDLKLRALKAVAREIGGVEGEMRAHGGAADEEEDAEREAAESSVASDDSRGGDRGVAGQAEGG